jgi:hypothetical protein
MAPDDLVTRKHERAACAPTKHGGGGCGLVGVALQWCSLQCELPSVASHASAACGSTSPARPARQRGLPTLLSKQRVVRRRQLAPCRRVPAWPRL